MNDKNALRAMLADRRAIAAAADPDAGGRLAAHWPLAIGPGAIGPGAIVAGYVRFRSEIDPAPLMAHLAAHGARLALPVTPAIAGAGLAFRAYQPGDRLIKSRFGVLEPAETAPLVTPSVLIAPLLGFDAAGHRLGYGQGHYDRTLAALRAKAPVVAVGLAFAEQGVAALPAEPHDQRLDWVITPAGAVACA